MKAKIKKKRSIELRTSLQKPRLVLCILACTLLVLTGIPGLSKAQTIIFNTAPYWATARDIDAGLGLNESSTEAETFVAPQGATVLNDFTFYAQSYSGIGGVATLQLQAFVYAWSGSLFGHGGGATGNPIYLGPSFTFSPPPRSSGWTSLTADFGGNGVTLIAGHQYVMGFTLSAPANYAASQGDIEFQAVPVRNSTPSIPPGVDFGNGGAVWLNNSNNFAALNSTVWDTQEDIGALAFTAEFTVPEPSSVTLFLFSTAVMASRRFYIRRKGNRQR